MDAEAEALLRTAALVRRGVNRLDRRLRAQRPAAGIVLSRLSLLGHLREHGPRTAGELAALDRVQPQSVTRNLAALEADGLIVRRQRSTDRRQAVLELTEQGHQVLDHDLGGRDRWLAEAMAANLTGTEQDLLYLASQLLNRLAGVTSMAPAELDPSTEGAP